MKKRVIKAQSPQIAPKRARRFDFGPLVLLAGLLLLGVALFLLTIYRPVYDEAETREHLFMGRKADRIIGMTGFNGEYRSEFLTIPDSVQIGGTEYPTQYVDLWGFAKYPICHVLLPDTVIELEPYNTPATAKCTLYTDDPDVAAQAKAIGFQVGDPETYHALYADAADMLPEWPVLKARVLEGLEDITRTPWGTLACVGAVLLVLKASVMTSVASGKDLKDDSEISRFVHSLFAVLMLYLSFFGILAIFAGDQNFETDSVYAFMFNWPLKLTLAALAVTLLLDLYTRTIFPWFVNRLIGTILIMVGGGMMACVLGLLGQYVSRLFIFLPMAGYLILPIFALATISAFFFVHIDPPNSNNKKIASGASGGESTLVSLRETGYTVRDKYGSYYAVGEMDGRYFIGRGIELYGFAPHEETCSASDGRLYHIV